LFLDQLENQPAILRRKFEDDENINEKE